ncbi:DUF6931 family protein [Xanthobacter sp. TB0139]|uniref:DUF6931 family protein n=1 Tax=Xanthobacter sp. TB0139 TaxID=3459178 RepID=UPI004039FD82
MKIGHLPKLRFALADHLCTLIEPSDEVKALLRPGLSAVDMIRALAENGLTTEAIRYLALGLPRREAVWWACAARRHLLPQELPEPEAQAWQSVERWVYEPTEENRQAAYPCAEALKFETAAGYAALAVFWSGGSLAPPEAPAVVPPGDGLTACAAGASLILCCVPGEAKNIATRHEAVLAMGVDIGNGGSGLHPAEART